MRRLLTPFLVAALTLCAHAQTTKSQRTRRPAPAPKAARGPVIESIAVEGASHLSDAEILRLSGLKKGDPPVKEIFESARDRLLATGCIETVGWRYAPNEAATGYDAVISITEADQFLPWTVERLPIEPAEFAAAAEAALPCFGKQIPSYERYLERASKLLAGLLAKRGFTEEITPRVQVRGATTLTIVFQPTTAPPSISAIRFTGNKSIPEQELFRVVSPAVIGIPFTEPLVRQILANQVKPMYEAQGRLTVNIPKITATPSTQPGVTGVAIEVEIDEGPVFNLDEVEFNFLPLPEGEIERLGQFERGKPVSYTAMALAMERIFKQLRENGYMNCSYKARRSLNTEKLTARLIIDVDTGPRFLMGKLTIAGLDVISEPAIRRLWTLEEGTPFRASYPDYFLSQVRERQILDFLGETKSDVKLDEKTLRANVTLTFKGGAQPLDSRDPVDRRRPPGF